MIVLTVHELKYILGERSDFYFKISYGYRTESTRQYEELVHRVRIVRIDFMNSTLVKRK